MTKRSRRALRRSIWNGLRLEVNDYLRGEVAVRDEWCGLKASWKGPEVEEETEEVIRIFEEWWLQAKGEAMREDPLEVPRRGPGRRQARGPGKGA